MAEPTQYMFTHRDVVTALIKQQGLRDGKWKLSIKFVFAASNIGPSDSSDLNPAAIAAVSSIGLQRAEDDVSNLCVDAATVGATPAVPAPKRVKSAKRKRAKPS